MMKPFVYGAISWPILDLVSRLVVTLESQYWGFFAAVTGPVTQPAGQQAGQAGPARLQQ